MVGQNPTQYISCQNLGLVGYCPGGGTALWPVNVTMSVSTTCDPLDCTITAQTDAICQAGANVACGCIEPGGLVTYMCLWNNGAGTTNLTWTITDGCA
jgi:hypothetical protein